MLNIFVEAMMHLFRDSLLNRKFKRTAFISNYIYFLVTNVKGFTVTVLQWTG